MIAATKFRRGMIFTRIRVGKLSNLGQSGKYPCVIFSCFISTTFIEEWLLVVEAVNCFGSGVEGLSVFTHTHTPPLLTSLTQAIPLSL